MVMRRCAAPSFLRAGARSVRANSTWANVPLGPPDPILGLTVAYNEDTFPQKVNLGAGAYRDDDGKPFQLRAVREAEKTLGNLDMEYAPIAGVPAFTKAAQNLLFGAECSQVQEGLISTMQTISGTGALRVAGDFLAKFRPGDIYLPTPTWGNHGPIFSDARLPTKSYRYYRASDCGLDIDGMVEDLRAAPDGTIILLHACAHNPTGVDPTQEEWNTILKVMQEKKHFAFFDAAYQGFATGDTLADAYAVRLFAKAGVPMLACQSFAKNFGLYGHRAGAVHFVCGSADEKARMDSQLKILIRPMYSNPPIHGARIVAAVLNDANLTALWNEDVKVMANRIGGMRAKLVDALKAEGSVRDWSHVTKQIGMFSFTGLTKDQCDKMIKDFHVYLTANGRISVASLTNGNVGYVAKAMHAVTK